MDFSGYIIVGPTPSPTNIEILTQGRPSYLNLQSVPLESHCGGSYCGTSYPLPKPNSFVFTVQSNVSSRINYWYRIN